MRTSILAAALLGVFTACTGTIDTGGGGDDVQGGPDCGNGVVDTGEACDDGNTASGDGCSASCATETTLDPRVTVVLDKTAVATELGKAEVVTLTLTSVDGFTGNVNVTGSVLDNASAPLTGPTLTGPSSVAVSADGTATAMYMLQVPANATGTDLTGSLKFDVSSPAGTEAVSASLSIAAIFTVTYAAGTGGVVAMHPVQSTAVTSSVTVKRGTKIRFMNNDTVRHITHGGGIFTHENTTTGGVVGQYYEQPTLAAAPGSTGVLGCHENGHGGDAGYVNFRIE